VDDDRIVSLGVEDSDLQQRAVLRWADQHREGVVCMAADGVADGVPDVLVGDSVLATGSPIRTQTIYLV
jgi:hypothetical protein